MAEAATQEQQYRTPLTQLRDFIVFLVPSITRPGEIMETDPQSYDSANPVSTPPGGAPDDVMGWYTFRAVRPDWYRYDQSSMHYFHGRVLTRQELLDGSHDRGPQECQGGPELWVELPNGMRVPYHKGDCNHMKEVRR
jgi:hypothetical protein